MPARHTMMPAGRACAGLRRRATILGGTKKPAGTSVRKRLTDFVLPPGCPRL
jgi:hypothetical protein